MTSELKIPPSSPDVERTVLGTMIADSASTAAAVELLDSESFYFNANKIIFRAIKDLFVSGIGVDLVSISNYLQQKGQLEAVGDVVYLSELSCSICSFKNMEHYCGILLDKHERRANIHNLTMAVESYFTDEERNASDISSSTISQIISSQRRDRLGTVRIGELLPQEFERIEAVGKGEYAADIVTGYPSIDNMAFIKNADLVIIGGRPSMGKTSVTDCLVRSIAFRQKKRILKINLESSNENDFERSLFSEARINLHQFRAGTLPQREISKLSFAAGPLSEAEIYLNDDPFMTPSKIHSVLHRLNHEKGKVDLLVIDFLQLLNGDRRYESKRIEVGDITKEIKSLGKSFNIPVFLISQLSRMEKGMIRRPNMADLKESGDIEQNADVIILLHREEYYCRREVAVEKGVVNKIDVIIAKNKNGPVGVKEMVYLKEYMRLEEAATNTEEMWYQK